MSSSPSHAEQQQPVQRWVVRAAWPTKYDPSDLNAKGNEVVIETLELAVERVGRLRRSPAGPAAA